MPKGASCRNRVTRRRCANCVHRAQRLRPCAARSDLVEHLPRHRQSSGVPLTGPVARLVALCGGLGRRMRRVRGAKAAGGKRRVRPRSRKAPVRNDAVETALATLAHEIRTPLNGILALSELLAAADLPQREREWASL